MLSITSSRCRVQCYSAISYRCHTCIITLDGIKLSRFQIHHIIWFRIGFLRLDFRMCMFYIENENSWIGYSHDFCSLKHNISVFMLLVSLCLCVHLALSLCLSLSVYLSTSTFSLDYNRAFSIRLASKKKLQSSNSSLLANLHLRCFHNFSDLNSFFPLYIPHSNKIHEHFHKAKPTQPKIQKLLHFSCHLN